MKFDLRRSWERIRTVPGLGRDVAFVAALIVGAMVSLSIMWPKMTTAFPWEDRQIVRVEFERVPGVNPNSSHKVTIAGVIVGQITGWQATERGTGILELDIDGAYTVHQNARAVLRAKNVLNDMTVEINPGGPPAPPVPEDGFIPLSQTERPIQVDEILNNLPLKTQNATAALLEQSDAALVRAPQQLPAGLRATQGTLQTIRPVMERLEVRRQKIATLVTSLSDIAQAIGKNDERAARLIDSTQQTFSVLAQNDEDLRAALDQLPGLNDALRESMTSVQPLTEQLNATIDNLDAAQEELPDSLERFEDTVREIDETVDAAEPFLEEAEPVLADLRPFIADVDPALDDLRVLTESLKQDSETLVTYKTNIQAFTYNTRSVFGGGNGPTQAIIRGFAVARLPDGEVLPGGAGGYAPGPENGLPPMKQPVGPNLTEEGTR